MLIYADEPHHTRQRRIVGKGFSPRIVELVAPKVQALVDELIDGFAGRGEADLAPEFANAVAMGGICEMLGIPRSDRALFVKWTDETIAAFGGNAESYEQSFTALQELSQYFMAEIDRRRALRTTTEATEIAGCPIPDDAKVRVMYASANRDKDYLPDADEFSIQRDPKALRRHLSFGFGIHACVGSAMGRMELRTAVRTLFQRLPDLQLDPARPARRLDAFFMRGWETLPAVWTPPKTKLGSA